MQFLNRVLPFFVVGCLTACYYMTSLPKRTADQLSTSDLFLVGITLGLSITGLIVALYHKRHGWLRGLGAGWFISSVLTAFYNIVSYK